MRTFKLICTDLKWVCESFFVPSSTCCRKKVSLKLHEMPDKSEYYGKNRAFVKWCWWPRKLHFRNGVEFFCSRRFLLCFFKLVQLRINTACVSAGLEAARSVYLRGVNEYMTQQNALDLIVKNHPQFEKVYDAYQDVFNALKEKTGRGSLMFWKTTVVRVRTWTQPSPHWRRTWQLFLTASSMISPTVRLKE